MPQTATRELNLSFSDVMGHARSKVGDVPIDATIAELIEQVASQMNFPRNDVSGRPLVYKARRERGGVQFQGDELAVEVFEENDNAILEPNVEAG